MLTIKVTRTYGSTGYFGTFPTTDSAKGAAAKISASGAMSGAKLDIVTIPDGITPMPLAADYLRA